MADISFESPSQPSQDSIGVSYMYFYVNSWMCPIMSKLCPSVWVDLLESIKNRTDSARANGSGREAEGSLELLFLS